MISLKGLPDTTGRPFRLAVCICRVDVLASGTTFLSDKTSIAAPSGHSPCAAWLHQLITIEAVSR